MEDKPLKIVYETNCPKLPKPIRGKVRDNYHLGDRMLIVATDRLSAFDVVSEQPVPEKGRLLTQISAFWFGWLGENFPWIKTHFIAADWGEILKHHPELKRYADQLAGRSMLVDRLVKIFPVEAIVRLYLYGSGLKDYQATGEVCGIKLPAGMVKADQLPAPMFSPSTKAELGQHDENISFESAVARRLVTQQQLSAIAGISSLVLSQANEFALKRGVIIPDTKFEFGLLDNELVLADEVLTPDSSRFWPADKYQPGQDQPSYDKQFVREYLEEQAKKGLWNKKSPMPELPAWVIAGTTERYLEIARILTGSN
ncbi:MAG: phosphoribosylaminoimidazolesuccinocarboxamide synthase [Patescibacteria group bacterium]|jgi:phosphoribosylaminoimidazole-succinocarboxamide synthase|nr:phosphoribosylaminoimidazolesuccinocarboxamide synthase [Patescibacteria group bacterium]